MSFSAKRQTNSRVRQNHHRPQIVGSSFIRTTETHTARDLNKLQNLHIREIATHNTTTHLQTLIISLLVSLASRACRRSQTTSQIAAPTLARGFGSRNAGCLLQHQKSGVICRRRVWSFQKIQRETQILEVSMKRSEQRRLNRHGGHTHSACWVSRYLSIPLQGGEGGTHSVERETHGTRVKHTFGTTISHTHPEVQPHYRWYSRRLDALRTIIAPVELCMNSVPPFFICHSAPWRLLNENSPKRLQISNEHAACRGCYRIAPFQQCFRLPSDVYSPIQQHCRRHYDIDYACSALNLCPAALASHTRSNVILAWRNESTRSQVLLQCCLRNSECLRKHLPLFCRLHLRGSCG